MTPPSTPVHPAFTAGNIHTHVKTTLTLQDSEYRTWRHVFNVHCGSYGVQGHLTGKAQSSGTDTDKEQWQRLDFLVLSWIYATISPELLAMVIDPDATAHMTWDAIEKLFLDNQKARALALMEEYSNCVKGNSSIADYCNRLKKICDQLKDVDHTISNEDLVLKCLRGLPSTYQTLYNIIPLQTPFPDFLKVRSILLLEENRQIVQEHTPSPIAPTTALYTSYATNSSNNNNNYKGGKGKQPWKNKGGNNKNKNNNQNNNNNTATRSYPPTWTTYPAYYPIHPTPNWNPNAGILGPRPCQQPYSPRNNTSSQAFVAQAQPNQATGTPLLSYNQHIPAVPYWPNQLLSKALIACACKLLLTEIGTWIQELHLT